MTLPRKGKWFLAAGVCSVSVTLFQLKSENNFSWSGAIENFPDWISTAPNPTLMVTTVIGAIFTVIGAAANLDAIFRRPAATLEQVEQDGGVTRQMMTQINSSAQSGISEISAALAEINQSVIRRKIAPRRALNVIKAAIRSRSMSEAELVYFSEIFAERLKTDGVQSQEIISNLVRDMQLYGYRNLLDDALANLSGESRSKIIDLRAEELNAEQETTSARFAELATFAATENPDRAIELFRKAIEIDPTNTVASVRLGNLLFRYRTIQEARERFHIAMQSAASGLSKNEIRLALTKILRLEGKSDEASAECLMALKEAEMMVRDDPKNDHAWHQIADSHLTLGDIFVDQASLAEAKISYESTVKSVRDLEATGHYCSESAFGLGAGLQRLASLKRTFGEISDGLHDLGESRKVAEAWIEKDPANIEMRRNLLVQTLQLGDFQIALGHLDEARASFEDVLVENEAISRIVPNTSQVLRDKAIALMRIGELHLAHEQYEQASAVQLDALDIIREISVRDELNHDLKRDVSVALEQVGDTQINYDNKKALSSYTEAMEIRSDLNDWDPANKNWLRDLSVSFRKIGTVYLKDGNNLRALDFFGKSLVIDQQLFELDPNTRSPKFDLFDTLKLLSSGFWDAGLRDVSEQYFSEATSLINELVRDYPDVAIYLKEQDALNARLDRLKITVTRP